MQIYALSDSIEVIESFLTDHRGVKSIRSKMAAAAGCQLSYLSQALAGKVQLTPDHAFGIAKFMNLDVAETEYFLLLVQIKRTSLLAYRKYLNGKLAEIRKTNFKLETKLVSEEKLSDANLQRYYSDWRMQAIHMYLTIPRYQRLAPLASKLKLDELETRSLLDVLVSMGLAKKNKDLWSAGLKNLHVPIRSPHSLATQMQWKIRALQDLQKLDSEGIHYVGTFSLSVDDIEKLKALVIDFVAHTRSLAQASPEEEVAHLGISFFQL